MSLAMRKILQLLCISGTFLEIIILFVFLFSCSRSNTNNANTIEAFDSEINEDSKEEDVIGPNFNIYRFKSQLDSLLSITEYKNFQFQLNIDTVNEKTNSKILWHFNKCGLFKIINLQSTSQLVFYHFLDPKTSKILRIYLIEASYEDPIAFDEVHESFLIEKDRKKSFFIEDDEEEYFIEYGLTWLNDYVIILENKIYWLNLSSQYSKKNFNIIINYFQDNLIYKNYLDTIKCNAL